MPPGNPACQPKGGKEDHTDASGNTQYSCTRRTGLDLQIAYARVLPIACFLLHASPRERPLTPQHVCFISVNSRTRFILISEAER